MHLSIRTPRILCPLLVFAAATSLVVAQQQSTGKVLMQDITNNSNGNREGEVAKPTYVSGQVTPLVTGAQPSGRIVIERVCTDHTYQEGYADAKGHFQVQLGTLASTMPDASFTNPARFGDGTRVGTYCAGATGSGQDSLLWGCNIRAALSGYRSNSIPLEGRRLSTNPDIGTIILTRMEKDVEGYTISVTLCRCPSRTPREAYDKGVDLEHQNKGPEAQKEFLRAVELYPKHAAALYELGRTYEHANQVPQAREAYQKAIEADPNYVNPIERMYVLAVRENKWQEAADFSDKVLRLDPYEFGQRTICYNSLAHLQLHYLEVA